VHGDRLVPLPFPGDYCNPAIQSHTGRRSSSSSANFRTSLSSSEGLRGHPGYDQEGTSRDSQHYERAETFTNFRDHCGCPTGARAYKLRILRKRVLCRRENATSFPSFRTKTRSPSLLSRGCLTWPRLTMELLLARKNIELSSLRSMLPRERRRRMLPLAKCTSVEFRHASRREIPSICTIQALESSVSKAKSSRRNLAGSPSPKQE
jgi:hypothetical protein